MMPSLEPTDRPSNPWKQLLNECLHCSPSQGTIHAEVQLAADDCGIQEIRGLVVEDQAKLLEIIDEAAPAVLAKDTKFVATLGDISSSVLMLPESTGSLRGLEKRGEIAVASGAIADIWKGVWGTKPVAFKAFRFYPTQELLEAKKVIWRLAPIWKRLVHENVLPFYGVDTSMFQLALVYEWGQNGNIMEYLEFNPEAPRPKLLLQVAKGVQYLHSLDVVHGDLKGSNVLISESGNARVSDYDMNTIMSNPVFTALATLGVSGSSRWLSPEFIYPPSDASSGSLAASKSADVFAFAMLAVEVFTGKAPFWDMNGPFIIHIARGERPVKPQAAEQLGLTAELWELIQRCWSADPNARPSIDDVVGAWEGFVNGDASMLNTFGCQSQSQSVEPLIAHNKKSGGLARRMKRIFGLF